MLASGVEGDKERFDHIDCHIDEEKVPRICHRQLDKKLSQVRWISSC